MTHVCIGLPIKKIANPASALGPKLMSRRTRQISSPMGEDHAMWKNLGGESERLSLQKEVGYIAQKSIRETSVEMWLMSLPLDNVVLARDVRRRLRLKMADMSPPRTNYEKESVSKRSSRVMRC